MAIVAVVVSLMMTGMGGMSWWYAHNHDGLKGLTAVLTVVSVGCLLASGVYLWRDRTTIFSEASHVDKQTQLKQKSYFGEREAKRQATVKQHLNEKNVTSELNKAYRGTIGPVTFNQATKTYQVTATQPDYLKALRVIQQYPDKNHKALLSVKKSFIGVSKSIAKPLGNGYRVQLVDREVVLLTTRDGQLVSAKF